MKLSTRIAVGYLALVALMAVLAVYQLALVQRLHGENLRLAGVDLEAARAALRMRVHSDNLSRLTSIMFIRRDAGYVEELAELRERMEGELEALRGLPLSAGERARLGAVEEGWSSYRELADRAEPRVLAGETVDRGGLLSALDEVEAALGELEEASRRSAQERAADSARAASRARSSAWLISAVAVAVGLLLAFVVAASVARPLRRLRRGTREIARGDFDHRVPPSGGPELAALARDFNAMADRLGELDRLKRDFVSAVSHDLKAPLASMQETTRLLLDGTPGTLDDDQERLLRLNLESGERLTEMIYDLLEAARMDAGAVDLELERSDLGELCRRSVAAAQGVVHTRPVEVEVTVPEEPVPVEADGGLLVRAVGNLLSNAAKFSPAGSRIDVRVRRVVTREELERAYRRPPDGWSGPLATLEVRDRGPGIPDSDKELVFERFHRVDARHRGVQGTGLGLAIARGVAEGHGGALWVEDASDGGSGSRFVMALPLDAGPEPAREDTGRSAGAAVATLFLAGALLAAGLGGCASAPRPSDGGGATESEGDRLLAAGKPVAAAKAWERQIALAGDEAADSQPALFHLALLHLAPESPLHNPAYGDSLLRRLVQAHPDGVLAAEARWLLALRRENGALQEEVEHLRRQLEELRRIDLEEPP